MITHFQFKPLYQNSQLPGWKFSFYFQKQQFSGIYHQSGTIEWSSVQPDKNYKEQLEKHIHELMLFHVYEN
ncbi:YheE family protein [Bacillus sp. T3]|uniref:YheE family protein n=1 Tax=Bacillus sp. T3 TaxID=467262 RepID=UPI0029827308|nr:YheE family protein [Bacillus sp. T3]